MFIHGFFFNSCSINSLDPYRGYLYKEWETWGNFWENKEELCETIILALTDGVEDFTFYNHALGVGLGCVLIQRDKVIAYASQQ